ncbi:YjfA family protein [Micromonospora sp. NBC_01699]|uniref:DUF2690 domain-containing protein n=1 Tax=Micromonospora sp. NBC_01699 TaxID=2975984 RepID=UPI002E2A947E|nr:DUF2690 domain-containing protein [Micromonospora sp. NBC_01699]
MIAILALGVVSTLPNPQAAMAGSQHHGTDPAVTGCNQNAFLVATRDIETEYGQIVSYVDVYYSSSCATNWIRVRSNPAGGATVKNLWADGQPGIPAETDYGTGSSYSMQVYAPGSTCIHFQVHLKYSNGSHYAETYNAGSNYETVC